MKFDKTKLRITPSSFRDAKNLQNSFGKALLKNSLNLGIENFNSEDVLKSELSENTIGELIKAVLQLVVSDDVEKSLFACAERVIYDNAKIDEDYFEDVEHRTLYYPIMFEVMKVNIGPFIESLFSQFGGLSKIIKNIPK